MTLTMALALVLLPLWSTTPASAQTEPAAEAPRGPSVMLCLYGDSGAILAGHHACPGTARQSDDMLAEAHCFYDAGGRLWRGLPRCPHTAPPFLMREADRNR